jgi:hypothetical protein
VQGPSGGLIGYKGNGAGPNPAAAGGGGGGGAGGNGSMAPPVSGYAQPGAGGGGFMLFFAPPDRQKRIRKALQALLEIPFEIDRLGSQVIFYDPEADYQKIDLQRRVKKLKKERDLTRDCWK